MTIKIISTKGPSEANLAAVEREEQIRAVAQVLTSAWGKNDSSDLEICAAKIRSLKAERGTDSIGRLASDVSNRLLESRDIPWTVNSLDMDIERVMKLLEG